MVFMSNSMAYSSLLLFLPMMTFIFSQFPDQTLAVEQTLIIDFEKPRHSARPRSQGDYPPDPESAEGFGNSLTIEKGTRVRQSRGDGLPSSLQELKELIRNMDKVYARRFEQLSKRVDRLEANQQNFRHVAMADWSAFSVDKRIRLFGHAKSNWAEADQMCRAHSGELLQIDSELENERISDFLKGTEGIYWIGTQSTLHYTISSAGNYSNFEWGESDQPGQEGGRKDPTMQRCAAMSARNGGRWMRRECGEKHGFICQI